MVKVIKDHEEKFDKLISKLNSVNTNLNIRIKKLPQFYLNMVFKSTRIGH